MGLGGFVVPKWRVAPLVFWAPVGPAARELSAPCVVACGSAGVPGAVGPGRCVCRWAAARPLAVRAASFARRVASKPGQAPPPPTGTATDPSGALHTCGAWCAGVWFGASARCPARPRHPRAPRPGPPVPPAPSTPVGPGVLACGLVCWVEARPGSAAAHGHRSQALRSLRRPPCQWGLVCWRVVWCVASLSGQAPPPPTGTAARPSGPSGALHASGAWCAGVWFGVLGRSPAWLRSCLSNFARNSPVNISNYEFVSLGFQRFWALLKLRAIELRATFLGVVTAVTRCSLWRPSHWCGLLCCCVCYSRIQLVFGTKFALRGLLVVTAVESLPCVGKTRQIVPFWASRASFVSHMR